VATAKAWIRFMAVLEDVSNSIKGKEVGRGVHLCH
jgi:predicted RNA-binding protein YlxR (DUF448 family)